MADFENKLDLLDRILTKNINWIGSADSKGTFLFAIDSAMLAVLAALVPSIDQWTIGMAVFASFSLATLSASVLFIVLATVPRLDGPRNSKIYFGGIASFDEDDYVSRISEGITEDLLRDFARQIHQNAEIAKRKFDMIKRAFISTFLALPVWLISIWLMYPIKFPGLHS